MVITDISNIELTLLCECSVRSYIHHIQIWNNKYLWYINMKNAMTIFIIYFTRLQLLTMEIMQINLFILLQFCHSYCIFNITELLPPIFYLDIEEN